MDTVRAIRPLCRLEEIPDGAATALDVTLAVDGGMPERTSLIVLRHGEQVQGFLNMCPHAGSRLDYAPGRFLLKSDTLICAVHGAVFKQIDGLCIGGPCRGEHLRAVALRVADGAVHLAGHA
ncbi:MAG: Rieske 2Fe-2S domain-containing protein [Xanthomonadaceae bacterium]|nr:Rieske 2Fe-2S domain-containing protein [Xanthomonadaceae bacterium]